MLNFNSHSAFKLLLLAAAPTKNYTQRHLLTCTSPARYLVRRDIPATAPCLAVFRIPVEPHHTSCPGGGWHPGVYCCSLAQSARVLCPSAASVWLIIVCSCPVVMRMGPVVGTAELCAQQARRGEVWQLLLPDEGGVLSALPPPSLFSLSRRPASGPVSVVPPKLAL